MPKTSSAKKRLRTSYKRYLRNRSLRSRMKTLINETNKLIEAGNLDEAKKMYNIASSAIDKASQKGSVHKNKAGREKSKLGKKLSNLEKK